MSNGFSYSLEDFIPFTTEIYFRLLERMGETFWPMHLLTIILGAVTLWLALNNRARLASLLIAPVWAFIAVAFFIQFYAELNWAGSYMAYVFLTQAALLLLLAVIAPGLNSWPGKKLSTVLGSVLALAGLIGLPLIGLASGGNWFRAEVFGIHPDPTSVTTLGLALIMFRGWMLWLITLIPAVWLLYSGLTLWALDIPAAIVPFILLAMGLIGLVWKSLERRFI